MIKETRQGPTRNNILQLGFFFFIPFIDLYTGASVFDWWLALGLYFFRIFWIGAGYHRYFSHRSYKTSRVFQFILAFFSETSAQKGVLWWASHHRVHHRTSDTPKDPHSMKIYGFWYSHLGWIMGPDYEDTDMDSVKDLAKFPEIRWIDKHYVFPVVTMALMVFIIGGFVNSSFAVDHSMGSIGNWHLQGALSAFLIGFCFSTAVLFHGTFSINSVMHKVGKQRYKSNDESRNSFGLALLTFGEGWHNNHHYYQSSARQGFFWWEIDITYYILKTLSFFGVVHTLKAVPVRLKNAY